MGEVPDTVIWPEPSVLEAEWHDCPYNREMGGLRDDHFCQCDKEQQQRCLEDI